jgi:hypothetical protein
MIKEAIEYIVKQTKPPRIQVDKPTNEQETIKIIPPAIELSSFFSFHEIGEIKRPFFIRLKQGSSQETQAGLFECPSDWEHKAIVKIQEYLEK